MQIQRLAGIMLGTVLGVSAVCAADSEGENADERLLKAMQQELQQLRESNQQMRSEIDELRAATTDDWLTEQRAKEIRGIVTDVLADADTRASLLDSGLMAGWSDGFFLASVDGRFKLNLEGQVQIRWLYNFNDERPFSFFGTPQQDRHRQGFENSRTRLAFSGHVYQRELTYMVRGDFSRSGGTMSLLDAWVRYQFNNEWSLRFGQFKLPFSREQLVPSSHQLAVERSVVDNNLSIGRSQGIELLYTGDVSRFSLVFSDGGTDNIGGPSSIASGSQAVNTPALVLDSEYAWTGRYEHLMAGDWQQFQDFTSPMDDEFGLLLGIGAHIQRTEANGQPSLPTQGRRDIRWYAYTIDASAEWGGANAFLSFTHHYIDQPPRNINIFGVVAQAGMYVTPKIELFTRFEYGSWHFDAPPGNEDFTTALNLATAGVNYYLDGHDAKWTTDIGFGISRVSRAWGRVPANITGWRSEGEDARPQIVFRTQFQLLF